MLASSSQAMSTPEVVLVSLPKITDAPPNTHVFWLEPSETHRGYGCHAFHPSGQRILDKAAVPVIFHQGTWYTLRHKAGNSFPHLGAKHPDISLFDVHQPPQIEEADPESDELPQPSPEDQGTDSEDDPNLEDDSLLQAIRLTPLTTPIVRTSTPLPLVTTMATSTSTTTQTTLVPPSTSAPAASSTGTQPPTGTTPADIADSLQ